MDLLRASLHTDDLPIVIGEIPDSWNDKDGKVCKTDYNASNIRTT